MNIDLFLTTLLYMGKGMLGIFAVTVIIILFVMLINMIGSAAYDKKNQK